VNWCPQVGQKTLGGGCERVEEIGVGWGGLIMGNYNDQ